jgi:hypothetical protein
VPGSFKPNGEPGAHRLFRSIPASTSFAAASGPTRRLGGLPKGAEIPGDGPDSATARLLRGQMIGAGIGVVPGLVSVMLMMGRSKVPLVPAPAQTY